MLLGTHANGSLCSTQEPRLSEFHRKNEEAIERLMCEGGAFTQINKIMENHVEREFPRIAKRFRESENVLKKKYGVERMFGPFWSFCVNAPRYHHGIQRVHCGPHVDALNLAIGICVVFVYGHFNDKELSWLVIWEAGVVIQLPAGCFLMYPSSLFFHFNIDLKDINKHIVTGELEEGEIPTLENTKPTDAGVGRGSVVWFNQATMFQTAELGVASIKEAKAAGMDATCDANGLIHQGLFPQRPEG
ncbi:hypothetical protein FPV67DRAFT_1662574 [Lyophyllum atratum]|nr:hypothetical protein FPV67DRAFT_1662574 [Lyophyllum atratum]